MNRYSKQCSTAYEEETDCVLDDSTDGLLDNVFHRLTKAIDFAGMINRKAEATCENLFGPQQAAKDDTKLNPVSGRISGINAQITDLMDLMGEINEKVSRLSEL